MFFFFEYEDFYVLFSILLICLVEDVLSFCVSLSWAISYIAV